MWGDPSPARLWGEPVTVAYSRTRQSDAPIWDEVSQQGTGELTVAAEATPAAEPTPARLEAAGAELADLGDGGADLGAPALVVERTAEAGVVTSVDAVSESSSEELGDSTLASPAVIVPAPEPETALADRVEQTLAAISADGTVMECLAEADADQAAQDETATETEAAVEIEAAVEAEAEAAEAEAAELAPMMARTASDPAPMMSLEATTIMPPLSLLPPLPSSRGRGRPPVPPASRPMTPRGSSPTPSLPASPAVAEPRSPAAEGEAPGAPGTRSWATVTRLPVAPLMATPETAETPAMPGLDEATEFAGTLLAVPEVVAATPAPAGDHDVPSDLADASPVALGELRARLETLGLPDHLLDDTFTDDVAGQGTYAALTRALERRLPAAPELPSGAGEVLFVVGPGVETLRAARGIAASLRLDRDGVQWATRGELAGLAPKSSRVTTVETAMDRRQDASTSGTVTIVAVDAPLRSDSYWMSQMLAIWTPTAVWVVVEATRKPEDLGPWMDGLPRVDALVVTDTDLSADPAAVLRRVAAPVAIVDGVRATPHRWASLLCERLEGTKA
jgi:hypothetical protein